ncbi:MAG: ATP-binding protein [Kiritimatiellae bacterium]|nr:ATP-binding protein [Kiritimatiellia bacterium]
MGKPPVKVITGLRRSGKSVFVRQIVAALRDDGVTDNRLIYLDLESLENDTIRNYKDLAATVTTRIAGLKGRVYLFIDEIQNVTEWERVVSSWSGDPERYDVYITGSNSMLFSGALATKLTGRYVEIPVYPLSMSELLLANESELSEIQVFADYLQFGGMPGLLAFGERKEETALPYLSAIHDAILLKDVVERGKIRNVGLLRSICAYVYDSVGSPISANGISKYLKGQRLSVNVQTVMNYLDVLEAAQLVESVPRFDVRGKRQMEYNRKYYVTDIGLRNVTVGFRPTAVSHLLENVVFLELRRRGWRVCTGEAGGGEIDFVAEKNGARHYFQVTTSVENSEATAERELHPLLSVKDAYPKTLLVKDSLCAGNIDGVSVVPLMTFLRGGEG